MARIDRRTFVRATAFAVAPLSFPALLLPRRASASTPSAVVATSAGKVRGSVVDGINVFKAIPYGAPTGGANRFMPPRAPLGWSGIKDTFDFGFSSPQRDPQSPRGGPLEGAASLIGDLSGLPESEDCLVLNVWTPAVNSGGKRPVMFWCHGGGFTSGSGSSPGYDGTNLCKRGDVVVVTINHRLNAVGFLHLGDHAGSDFAQSGGVGMLDIVHALQWVRENIERFGGDPSNVMVFGESGGGRKVSVLQAMPSAQGLYHRAVVQSGPGIRMTPRDVAAQVTELMLAELGIAAKQPRELQDVPMERLLSAYHKVSRAQISGISASGPFAPTVDGTVLPVHPFAALKRGATYVYRFDWETPVLNGRLKTPHALEIPFAFDNTTKSARFTGGGADAAALADKVSDAWIAFARTGNPNTPKLPKWPSYDANARPTMLLSNQSAVVNDPDKTTRVAMESVLGFA